MGQLRRSDGEKREGRRAYVVLLHVNTDGDLTVKTALNVAAKLGELESGEVAVCAAEGVSDGSQRGKENGW